MKTIFPALFLIVLILSGCKKDSETIYDSMHFVRQGGGEIDFNLFPTDEEGKITAEVNKYMFRDTTIQLSLESDNSNAALFTTLSNAMKNKEELSGDFKQSTGLGGTWAYLYFVSGEKETEVTNTDLRNKLLEFETLVLDKIQ
jgi:hypothetical protein